MTSLSESPLSWKIWIGVWMLPLFLAVANIGTASWQDLVLFALGSTTVALMMLKPSIVLPWGGMIFVWDLGGFFYWFNDNTINENAYSLGLVTKEITFILYLVFSSKAKSHRKSHETNDSLQARGI